MAGPTEILTDDVKGLRDDLRKVEGSLKDSTHKVELDVRELSTQVRGLLTSIKLLAVLTASTLGASIWWGATLTANVAALDKKFDKLEASITRALAAPKDGRGFDFPPPETPRGPRPGPDPKAE